MDSIVLMGYVAAFCTTASFIPQVLHVLRTKDTSAISLHMYALFVFGVAMWLIYGLLQRDLPMIVANAITFALAACILLMKVKDQLKAIKASE